MVGSGASARLSARHWRLGLWLLLMLGGAVGFIQSLSAQPRAPVYLVEIDGVINPGTQVILDHAIQRAASDNAAALIMRLDTPGGLLGSTREMVSAIAEAPIPVIGYVGPAGASATSAGAFILLACHAAVMQAGTNLGASSPVAGDGADIQGTLGKKVMNDSRAFMRSVAESRGRNAALAESFVAEAASASAREALAGGLIDAVVDRFDQLPDAVSGRTVVVQGKPAVLNLSGNPIIPVEPRLADRLLQHLAHPEIAHLLLTIGMLGLWLELLSPGLLLPGVVGAIALVLGIIGVQALPVNTGFLLLLGLGGALLIAEYFVAGFGVLGVGGAIAFTLGSLNLFEGPAPQDQQQTILWVSIAVTAAMVVGTLLVTMGARLGTRRRSVAGELGEAMVSFENAGHVLVKGERWQAVTLEPLHHGDTVVVVSHGRDDRLTVKKAEQTSS